MVFTIAQETLPELATRLAAQLKKMRRHQRYDASKLSVTAGERQVMNRWFGLVLNIKVFDYQWIFLPFRRKPIPWELFPLMTLELALSRMNTVI
ncbi:hypothetical protein ACLK1T_04070 [Escherichia coli]